MKNANASFLRNCALLFEVLTICCLMANSPSQAQVTLTPLAGFGGPDGWLTPGENGYAFLGTANLERGIAYGNSHLYLVSRNGGNNIRILNPLTGADLGALPTGSGIISGGTFTVSTVAVGADGAIYVANLASPVGASVPFKVYRWANEASTPTVAFSSTTLTAGRLGDSFDAIGSGSSTRLLAGESSAAGSGARNGYAVLTSADGVAYSGSLVTFSGIPPNAGDFRLGITFADATRVLGTQGGSGNPVRATSFSGTSGTLSSSSALTTIDERGLDYAVINGNNLLATVDTVDSRVRIYDVPDLTNLSYRVLLASSTATLANANLNGTAAVVWGDRVNNGDGTFTARLYALNGNNGIQAFTVNIGPPAANLFNVTGGGTSCQGDGGAAVGLNGSETGVDYLLRTNGTYCGVTVAGTGSAISFGGQTNAGTYSVLASNTTSTLTRPMPGSAVVTVNIPPAITSGPTPAVQTNYEGGIIAFSISAVGTGVTYQWRRDGTNLINGGQISGANSPTLTISPAAPIDSAEAGHGYTCVASGVCSPPAISVEATAMIIPFVAVPETVAGVWSNRYNGFGGAAELAGWTAIDANTNVIVVGASDALLFGKDFLTIKYSSAGAPVWTNRYNGPGNRDDAPAGVAVDSSGNVIVTGYSWNGTNDDYYTAKYAAADGALLWEQRYNSPSNSTDQAVAVAVDALGNALVTGRSVHNNSQYDYKTIKYAAVDGAVLWESRHDGTNSSSDEPLAIAVDANGDAVVTGQTWNGANYDIYTAKYAAANGALVWERQYDEPIYSDDVDYVAALALDPDGNVVIAGRTRTFLQSDFYVAKYAAADGAVLWSKQYNGGVSYNSIRQDQATSVALDSSGNVAVTGRATDSAGREDYLTTKYAADGTFLWQKRFAGSPDLIERPTTVKADGAGNVIVSGLYTVKYDAANGAVTWTNLNSVSSVSMGVDPNGDVVIVGTSAAAGQNDLLTVKCAGADGAIVWEQRYDGPGNHEDTPKCVAIDAAGNVVVAGNSAIPGISATLDFYTTKYSPAGAVLWSRSYGNTNGISDDLISMALDPLGNVAVTGNSGGDYYTAKYAAADGSLLWEQGYANVANNIDEPRAVAADLAGNVIVTGRSYASATGFDYYTAKYAATDGSLLWERRYSGVASSQTDEASAVIVDGVGDVYVTGNSYGGANQDIYTAKYAAADGALIWEKRYNGSANINDYGKSLCLDPNGNVIITGRSSNGSNDDYYTAKYAGSDGALQWEQRFNSGASDTPTAIASDPVGNAMVTGFSQGSYCLTMKYDGGSGWPLWSQRLTNANQNFDFPIATDAAGDVIVAAWLYAGGKTDFHTVKLASENGALLWSAVYNGPVNGNDQFYSSRALSVGPAGEIVVAGGSDGQLNYNSVGNRDFFTIKYIAAVAANARPVVQNPIPDANITYGTPVNFTFAANAFNDPDAGQTLTYSAIGMPPGITFTPATRTFSGTPTVVGTNSVTVIATDNGSPALSTNDVFDIVIAKAPLTATANNQSRTYAETNPPLTLSYSAFVLGETAAVLDTPPAIATAATNGSPVGPYPITIAGGADDHYEFSYVGGTLNITPAALSLTADNTNRIYGAPNPAFTGGITGLAHGDNITATFGSSADTNTPPGIYPIIPALVDPDAKLGNYTVTTNPGTLTVTAAPLTVTANDTNRVYGAADPVFTGSLLGLVNGDNITATFTTTATIASPPGTYPITPVLSDPDGKLGNYFVTTNSGTLTVTSPPELSFTLGGGGGGLFTLSWPSSYAGFILESTESLTPPLVWQEVTNGITENGGTKSCTVTNDPGVTGRLYRLRLP